MNFQTELKLTHFCFVLCIQTKNNLDSQDIRVILSNYILNFEFPRDVYTILIAIFTIYIALKVFRFSIGLLASVVRPILLIILILVSVSATNTSKSAFDLAHNVNTPYLI